MKYKPNQIYHVFNQGNNKEVVFFNEDNYLFFLRKIRKHLLPYTDFLAYCLMPNHFHWLILPKVEGCKLISDSNFRNQTSLSNTQLLSHQIGIVLSSYTRAINRQENRSGSLFRKKTKVKDGWIEQFVTINSRSRNMPFHPATDYAFQCFRYIHQNPVKAGLVENTTEWKFSSAKDYAGLRSGTLCNQEMAKKVLGLGEDG
jgi:putative transposase